MKFKIMATGVLTAFVLSAGLVTSTDAATRTEIKRIIIEEAENSRVPVALALAVGKVESNFNERALSPVGARGVMQIMPKTGLSVFGVNKDELWDARLNIQLGIDYLEQLYDQYGGRWDLALSHYNGGSLKGGKGASARPHGYTRKYVSDVMRWKDRYLRQAKVWEVAENTSTKIADGWTPAKTRVRDLKLEDWSNGFKNQNVFNTHSSTQIRRRGFVNRHPWDLETDFDNADFFTRLARVRRSLDDFAPIVRWYPAEKG